MIHPDHDVAVIGAGFAGLAAGVALGRAGREYVILEAGDDVGGVWRDNTYPGCACDVPSHLYSLSFAPNPEWSSTYSPQPEIQAYLRRVAAESGVRERIRFGAEVQEAAWDDAAALWRLRTPDGEVTARAVIAAAGPLVEPKLPDVPGLDRFEGRVFHSARWDHDHDLRGRRVAAIGTGASAIQFVPAIQPEVAELHVYQRTAPWVLPRTARRLTRLERAIFRRSPRIQLAVRRAVYWMREAGAFGMLHPAHARGTKLIGLVHLRRQVPDRALRAKLTPDYLPGCKRILLSNDYFPSLTQPNVELVTDGIREVRARSIVAADGTERPVDTIIFGTGFHVTDPPVAERVRGRDGRTLAAHWADTGMQALRGTTISGFPNLYFLLGPNTGLGHTSVVLVAEAQARYAVQALEHEVVEARPEALAAWTADVQRRTEGTVWVAGGCASWYLDAQGRNTTVWPDYVHRLERELAVFDPGEYHITTRRPADRRVPLAA